MSYVYKWKFNPPDISTALGTAAWKGHTEVVRVLLAAGGSASGAKINGLINASRAGHTEIVRLLLQHGADATVSANVSIFVATQGVHEEVRRLLLSSHQQCAEWQSTMVDMTTTGSEQHGWPAH